MLILLVFITTTTVPINLQSCLIVLQYMTNIVYYRYRWYGMVVVVVGNNHIIMKRNELGMKQMINDY